MTLHDTHLIRVTIKVLHLAALVLKRHIKSHHLSCLSACSCEFDSITSRISSSTFGSATLTPIYQKVTKWVLQVPAAMQVCKDALRLLDSAAGYQPSGRLTISVARENRLGSLGRTSGTNQTAMRTVIAGKSWSPRGIRQAAVDSR